METLDPKAPPAGMEEIPSDIPNSEHKPGDMALEYTLQNFNALVAANTALQIETTNLMEQIALHQQREGDLETIATDARAEFKRMEKLYEQESALRGKAASMGLDLEKDLKFEKSAHQATQRRLDRALGYLDRTLDEEDTLRAPTTHTRPLAGPAIGPNLNAIEMPVRTTQRQDGDYMLHSAARRSEEPLPGARPRRY